MSRTRVKFCGMTRAEDAVAAAACGADAIGLVFYKQAPRCITIERARQILAALPALITPVALFVDEQTRVILDLVEELRIRHVQLNGHEPPEQVAELRGLSVIKAVRVRGGELGAELSIWRRAVASHQLTNLKGLVLETGGTTQPGGTGVTNDWDAVRRHRDAGDFAGLPPLIAAGGLTPETVAAVVRDLRPSAVDVSSGVESGMGQKSVEKMRGFAAAVRAADESGR
jgi:phosphoribosylanthranilate isomerase